MSPSSAPRENSSGADVLAILLPLLLPLLLLVLVLVLVLVLLLVLLLLFNVGASLMTAMDRNGCCCVSPFAVTTAV